LLYAALKSKRIYNSWSGRELVRNLINNLLYLHLVFLTTASFSSNFFFPFVNNTDIVSWILGYRLKAYYLLFCQNVSYEMFWRLVLLSLYIFSWELED
jgi:hypothetical protein